MKEVIAIIRMDMINKTKEALLKAGFPALTGIKVLGRGKKKVNFTLIEDMLSESDFGSPALAESISEGHRLIPKRLLTIVVKDDQVNELVETIITVNQKGYPGDGKIFVLPITESVRVRTGEIGELAL